MVMRRRWLALVGIVGTLSLLPFGCHGGSSATIQPGAGHNAKRVGTFRRTDLLVAYYKSDTHRQVLAELDAKRKQAIASGDENRAADLQRKGQAMQELAHRQLAGDAPLTGILRRIKPIVDATAEEAGVDVIVEKPRGQAVDVTELLVQKLASTRN
jgi:hypothetical protein